MSIQEQKHEVDTFERLGRQDDIKFQAHHQKTGKLSLHSHLTVHQAPAIVLAEQPAPLVDAHKQEQSLATGLLPQALPVDVEKKIEISQQPAPQLDSELVLVHASAAGSSLGGGQLDADFDKVPVPIAPTAQKFRTEVLPQLRQVGSAYVKLQEQSHLPRIEVPTKSGRLEMQASPIDEEREAMLNQSSLGPAIHKMEVLYANQIAPRIAKGTEAIRKVYLEKVSEENRGKIDKTSETLLSKLRLYKDKALDIWEGNEPMVREKAQLVTTEIKKRGLEVPLMFLGSLLVLWLSMSFIGWFAFPATSAVNHIGTQPYQYSHSRDATHLPGGVRLDDHIHPSQDVPMASMTDKIRMKYNDANDVIHDGMNNMPGFNDLKQQIPSLEDIKARIPTIDDATAKLNGLRDSMGAIIPDSISEFGAPPHQHIIPEPGTPPHSHTFPAASPFEQSAEIKTDGPLSGLGDLKLKAQDGLNRVADAINPAGLADAIHPAGIKDSIKDSLHEMKLKVEDRMEHIKDAILPNHAETAQAPIQPAQSDMGTGPSKLQDRLHHLMP